MTELPPERRRHNPDYGAWVARGAIGILTALSATLVFKISNQVDTLAAFAVATDRKLDQHEFRIVDHDGKIKDHAERLRLMEFQRRSSLVGPNPP